MKYIFKRILIGVGISLSLFYLRQYFNIGIINVNAATINDTTYRTRNLTGGTNDKNDFINSGTTFLGLYYDFNDFTISDDEDTVIFSYSINFFNNSGQTFDINERVTLVVDYTQNGTTYSDVTYFGTAQDGYAVFTHLPLGAKIKRFNIAAEPVPSCVGGSCSMSYSVGYRVHVNETCMTLLSDSTVLTQILAAIRGQSQVNQSVNNVNNSVNNVNNSVNNVNDTLNDDTVDNTNVDNSFSNLQDDYKSSTSYGAFSGFVTLPLTWVQTLLGGSECHVVNLPLPYLNSNLTLPCMGAFWNSMGSLSTLIELVWVAVIGIRIFNGLYLLVVEVKNPDPDKDMDLLKTWEV